MPVDYPVQENIIRERERTGRDSAKTDITISNVNPEKMIKTKQKKEREREGERERERERDGLKEGLDYNYSSLT